MNKLGDELKKFNDTIVINLHNTESLFRMIYIKLVPALNKIKKWSTSISVNFTEANEKHDEIYYKIEINKILKALNKAGIKVAFCIDEVSNSPEIQALAEEFNEWSLNNFQVSVIMTGLLKEISELSGTHNLTFLVRADRFYVKQLQEVSMAEAYIKTLSINSDQATELVRTTRGYAYAFQLIGDLMYENLSANMDYTRAWEEAKLAFRSILFNQAYDIISHELTEVDFEFLYAMTRNNNISSIIEKLNHSKQYVNAYRTKLIKYGLIKPLIRGKVGFTLPLFKEFIEQKYDELNWG